jgi:hypothetical protein
MKPISSKQKNKMLCAWPIQEGKFEFCFPWQSHGGLFKWFYDRWAGITPDKSKAYLGIKICGFFKVDYIWLVDEMEAIAIEERGILGLLEEIFKDEKYENT